MVGTGAAANREENCRPPSQLRLFFRRTDRDATATENGRGQETDAVLQNRRLRRYLPETARDSELARNVEESPKGHNPECLIKHGASLG